MNTKSRKTAVAAGMLMCALIALFISVRVAAKYTTRVERTFPGVQVQLFSRTIPLPHVETEYTYNGAVQGPSVGSPEGVRIQGTVEATNAGEYVLRLTLEDPENDCWADGTRGEKVIPWKIARKKIEKPTVTDGILVYDGTELAPEMTAFDEGLVLASGVCESDAGEYTAEFALADPVNYEWQDGTDEKVQSAWGIYVCRIGEDYYTAVTTAFEEDRTSPDDPVVMLCDWKEEAVNRSGTDALFLDGYTLSSKGTTVCNEGELTVFGPGKIASLNDEAASPTAVRNTGTLEILSGTFEAFYEGACDDTYEAYGVLNDGGETVIQDGTFTVSGLGLAAEAICVNSGSVIVHGGTFSTVNESEKHGAYAVWAEGGSAFIDGGSFRVENKAGNCAAFSGFSGEIEVAGGETQMLSNHGFADSFAYAQNRLKITVSGGKHLLSGYGDLIMLASKENGNVQFSGGELTLVQTSAGAYHVQGILVTDGAIEMTGGTLLVQTAGSDGAKGASLCAGTLNLKGGLIDVRAANGGTITGIYADAGTVLADGVTLNAQSSSGHIIGLYKAELTGTLSVGSLEFTMSSKTACLLHGAAASSQIGILNPSGAVFNVRYGDYYEVGSYYSADPTVNPSTLLMAPGAPGGKGAEDVSFSVGASGMSLDFGNGTVISLPRASRGEWLVTRPSSMELEVKLKGRECSTLLLREEERQTAGSVLLYDTESGTHAVSAGRSTLVFGSRTDLRHVRLDTDTLGIGILRKYPCGYAWTVSGTVTVTTCEDETGETVRILIRAHN